MTRAVLVIFIAEQGVAIIATETVVGERLVLMVGRVRLVLQTNKNTKTSNWCNSLKQLIARTGEHHSTLLSVLLLGEWKFTNSCPNVIQLPE